VFILKAKKQQKNKSTARAAFATAFIVSMAVLAAFFAFNIDLITNYFGSNPTGISRNPFQWKWNNQNNNNPSDEIFEEYIKDTVFIGDSRTVGLYQYRYINPENVYAKNGQNHQGARYEKIVDLGTGKLLTVAEAVGVRKPKRVIVSYGVNGVAFMSQNTFMEQYSYFIDDLRNASPASTIIIQSILPVSNYYQKYVDSRLNNDQIDLYNSLLKQLAKEKGCSFLDTAGLFKDSNNSLASEYDIGDGLHLSRAAYEVFLQYLDQHRIY